MESKNTPERGAEEELEPSRRTFVKLASAGALGAAALSVADATKAPQAGGTGGVRGSLDIKRPVGLGPRAMLDNRFPATFSESMPKGVEVVVGYFTALNQRDLKGVADYLHFPFATFEGIDAVRVATPEELLKKPPASLNMDVNPERFTDNDGFMSAGCYDAFRGLEVLCMDPVTSVISMSYDRYSSSGTHLLRCDGIYSVTNNDGRWAIQLMSTIFTPAKVIGIRYEDSEAAAKRWRWQHVMASNVLNVKDEPAPQAGATANVRRSDVAYGGAPWAVAPSGDYKSLGAFASRGVKSRLHYTAADAPVRPPESQEDYVRRIKGIYKLFESYGVGKWGFGHGISYDTRVIHQTYNKVHVLTGINRFNTGGELINCNDDVDVVTLREGYWGAAGRFCLTTPHDRSNDVRKI